MLLIPIISVSSKRLGLLFAIIISLTSCKITLISKYDEIIDAKTTAMQEDVSRFFISIEQQLGTDAAVYNEYIPFYIQAKVDLSTLKIRAAALEKNKLVEQQIQLLATNISSLEQLHKLGFRSQQELVPLINSFNTQFTAITKLQMGLKRGEK